MCGISCVTIFSDFAIIACIEVNGHLVKSIIVRLENNGSISTMNL